MPLKPIIERDALNDYAAFSDESHSDGNHDFMVIGGLLCRSTSAHQLAARVSALHAQQPFPEAFQWKSGSAKKVSIYKKVYDLAFEMIAAREIDFSCIVFDKRKVDHARHNENDPEKGFFKFLYQHHLSHVRRLGPESTYRCFHGNMETKYNLGELKRCLNGGSPRKGLKIFQPFVQVEFASVKQTRMLQLSDMLIGAVGYVTNGKHRVAPFSPKTELALYAEERSPVPSLAEPTKSPDWGFNIWHFRL